MIHQHTDIRRCDDG